MVRYQHLNSILKAPCGQSRSAFTLMETMLAIVIVGVGVLSIMYAQEVFHKDNSWALRTSTATYLANEVREMVRYLPRKDPVTGNAFWGPEQGENSVADFDDLDDFDGDDGSGIVFSADDESGPLDAFGRVLPGMGGWSQEITVCNVEPTDIGAAPDPERDGTTNFVRIQVTVKYKEPGDEVATTITSLAWVSRE